MIDFLTIVLLIFGVLQIILFFKIWGMTNGVKEVRQVSQRWGRKTKKGSGSQLCTQDQRRNETNNVNPIINISILPQKRQLYSRLFFEKVRKE